MSAAAMTALLVVTLSFFAWTVHRRFRQLRAGAVHARFSLTDGSFLQRLTNLILYVFGQKKMVDPSSRYRLAGAAHAVIFFGFSVLLLRTIMLVARGYDPHFDFFGLFHHSAPLGMAYGFAKDTVAILVLAGVSVFVWLRLKKTQRMTLKGEGLLILGIIATMMVADLLYDAAWFQLEARASGQVFAFRVAEWAGSSLSLLIAGFAPSSQTLVMLAHAGFWTHVALVLIFLNILPFSKHFHILTVVPNVFAGDVTPKGALPLVDDLEGKVEREEAVGIATAHDLSWKHILDLYTCTECGRCSDNCPAYTTGKKLSPKHLTIALRDHIYDAEEALTEVESFEGMARGVPAKGEEIHTNPAPPADAYFRAIDIQPLVPAVLHPDVIWSCTTCRACEEQCPVNISYVDKIVGMRREQVMMRAEFPSDLQRPFNGIESNGNPWNLAASDRGSWTDGLDIKTIEDNPSARVLYWVGCAASYDDRAKKISRSVAQLLQAAGVDFAILGTREQCTGDPARRAGNEYLFQMMAESNVETLNEVGADKKTIITACPHCFNTIANEYPQFGGHFEVVSHTDFLLGLVAQGRLKPEGEVKGKVAYHDSCYLGRYNEIYDSPRDILNAIPGLEVVEVDTWNKKKGLCCGAGGAQMFMEEREGKERVNTKRTLQLLDTGANTIASGCPFCMTMLTDGLKAEEKEETVRQLDVAELLAESVLSS